MGDYTYKSLFNRSAHSASPRLLGGSFFAEVSLEVAHLGAILGASWNHLGDHLGHPGPSWGHLGTILGHLRPSWDHLGDHFWASGAILRPSGDHLGPFRAMLGPSWDHLGTVLGHLGPSWAILGPSWDVLGPEVWPEWLGPMCAGRLAPHFGPILGPKTGPKIFTNCRQRNL